MVLPGRDRTTETKLVAAGYGVEGGLAQQSTGDVEGSHCVTLAAAGHYTFLKPAEHTVSRVSSNINCSCKMVVMCL